MRIKIDKNANKIIETIENNGYEAFIVGGCVRDSLMGKNPSDWDIATNARAQEVEAMFEKTIPTGIKHGTITVMLDGVGYEVTTYRIDGEYENFRHPSEVFFSNSIEEDLSRRDFTINAMAYNTKSGLVDFFEGSSDIKKKIIRCVGNPDKRFNEDALRIIRAIRFSAKLDFDIEKKTMDSMFINSQNLRHVSVERINTELEKILKYNPLKIKFLSDMGVLEWLFFGYLPSDELLEIAGEVDFDDVSREYFDEKNESIVENIILDLKRALIFKDLCSEKLTILLKKMRYSNKKIANTIFMHSVVNDDRYDILLDKDECINRKKVLIKGILREANDILLAKCAIYSKFIEKYANPRYCFVLFNDIIDSGECFSISRLKISGKDIVDSKIAEGAHVGKILNELLDYVIHNPLENEKEILLNLSRKIKNI